MTELSSPTISINLPYYLALACRGIDSVAILSKEMGQYLKTIDPSEEHCHVELMLATGLAHVYPIQEWRSSLVRREKIQARSEEERQRRFSIEAKVEEEKKLITHRREILQATISAVNRRLPRAWSILTAQLSTENQKHEYFEYYIFRALNGENPEIAAKFGITADEIAEFKSLPGDPEWKNRFYNPSGLSVCK